MYLERDDHATGLIRLLSVESLVLVLLEFVVLPALSRSPECAGGAVCSATRSGLTVRATIERLLHRL